MSGPPIPIPIGSAMSANNQLFYYYYLYAVFVASQLSGYEFEILSTNRKQPTGIAQHEMVLVVPNR